LGIFLGFVSSGCSFDVPIDASSLRCDLDGRCPRGFRCEEGRCVARPEDGATTCNGIGLLADDFARDRRDDRWGRVYGANGAAARVEDGRLRVTLPAGQEGAAYAGFVSERFHDLRGAAVSVEVARMVNVASGARMLFQLQAAGSEDEAGFEQQTGRLRFYTRVAGVEDGSSIAFDPDEQRFWRLREQAGLLFFETSPDGVEWSERRKLRRPFDLSLVRVELGAAVDAPGEAAPGVAEFDDVNGGVAHGAYCKVATLVDDFEDGERAATWARSYVEEGCALSEKGGAFVGEPPEPAFGPSYCAYASAAAYDLTGSAIAIEVAEMLDGAAESPGIAYFKLATRDDERGVELVHEAGRLRCRVWRERDVTVLGEQAYDEADHRWWRIAEGAGRIRWEASADGRAWTTLCEADTSSVDVDDVEVEIGVGVTRRSPEGQRIGRVRVERMNR
jgi:hypothetical protein